MPGGAAPLRAEAVGFRAEQAVLLPLGELAGVAPAGAVWRTGQSLTVHFVVTDMAQRVPVSYTGMLPDLFKEGKGVVAQGQLRDGVFVAREVLAKHDENYMPPEAAEALKRAQQTNQKIANTVAPGAAP